jgi:hypothetical protein
MAKVFGFKNIVNNEDKTIYVETAYEIFQKCLLKAGIMDNKNLPVRLADAITGEFIDNPLDASYIKNTYAKIKNRRNENVPYQEITLSHKYILALAEYAGIEDYMAYNQKYSPSFYINVLFASKPFGLLNFIRVAEQGKIKKKGSGWEYRNDSNEYITGSVEEINEFTMPGDRNPLWIQVKYYNQNNLDEVYFAEDLCPSIKPVTTSDQLFKFFKKMQNR